MRTEQLTVKEATEQGYTKFGFDDEKWQSVMDLSEAQDYFDHPKGDLVLFSKKQYSPSIDADTIKELLAEHISINHADETGDDTDNVYDSVKELDFEQTAQMINDKLETAAYWMATNIKLIP